MKKKCGPQYLLDSNPSAAKFISADSIEMGGFRLFAGIL